MFNLIQVTSTRNDRNEEKRNGSPNLDPNTFPTSPLTNIKYNGRVHYHVCKGWSRKCIRIWIR